MTHPAAGREEPTHPLGSAALAAGLGAALLGGAAWAGIVALTNFEVGWVAWGIGALVGLVMARLSPARGRGPALVAAGLALVGLLGGKILILELVSKPDAIAEMASDEEGQAAAAVWEMRSTRTLPAPLQERLDAVPLGDTLTDALWEEMTLVGRARRDSLSAPERQALGETYARAMLATVPALDQVRWTMGPFDILWVLLAVSSAWKMLATREEPVPQLSAHEETRE